MLETCRQRTALRRSAWPPWRRSWQLDRCTSLEVELTSLTADEKRQLAVLLPTSSVRRVSGAAGDGVFRAAVARGLASLPEGAPLHQVPVTAMLSAILLLGGVDYSREGSFFGDSQDSLSNNRVAHIRPSGACEPTPYALVDAALFKAGAARATDALLSCAPRRGIFVGLSQMPPVRGLNPWLNARLLPRMRMQHNMSFDVVSTAALRRASTCDCPMPNCCSGDGGELLFFVHDEPLLVADSRDTMIRPHTHSEHGVVMAADMRYIMGNPHTFALLAAQRYLPPVSLVTANASTARRAVHQALSAASTRRDARETAALFDVHKLQLPPGPLRSLVEAPGEYGFRLHKLPALLQAPFNLSIYLDIDVSLCATSFLADLTQLAHERTAAELFVLREGRRADGLDYVHGGVLAYRSTPLARSFLRTWLRLYLVTYKQSLDSSGRPRTSIYEQPALTKVVEAAQELFPESIHFLPTPLLARMHTGQVPLYLQRVASGHPGAALAHINRMKQAEKALWKQLVGNSTCGHSQNEMRPNR